ncbi:MAG: hypothetical protein ACRDS1_13680 [Pseudonocardiaceae bacterium]
MWHYAAQAVGARCAISPSTNFVVCVALRIRHDELTLALDDEPTAPEPAALAEVADRITEIIVSGTHNQTNRLIPVFRIPSPQR